jgi:energy-coupling factor transporter ATP-binding protein EcfA2
MDEYTEKTINNWKEYQKDIDKKVDTMWNLIHYNEFKNEEIRRLNSKIVGMKDHIDRLKKDNDDLFFENKRLKRKRSNSDSELNNTVVKRRRKENKLRKEYNLFKKNNNLDNKTDNEIDELISRVFQNLNSIYDIINLKNNENKYYFLNNKKFIKLYNIIPSLEELGNIIGMDDVKDTIFKNICYFIHGLNGNKELNHVMISGPPGVGKTTIAKIIGKIYLELDFLYNDKFMVATRSDLVAKYLGQTAIKTQKVIDSIIGGVLFIDEVYSLGNKEQRDSFAKECIDTINLNMTRDEPWLLIVGGYKEDIYDSFISYNKGLERRFNVKLNIDGYDSNELYQILLKFIKDDGFSLEENCFNVNDIETNKEYFKYYAGDMMKIFQKAKEYYSLRIMKNSLVLNTNSKILNRNDIINSINNLTSLLKNKDNNKYIFSMYT